MFVVVYQLQADRILITSVRVHTYVPMFDPKVGSLQDLSLWEICQGFELPATTI